MTIPDSVTRIGIYAFRNCTNLTSVTFASTEIWYVTDSSDYSGGTKLDASDLAVESTAATYLRNTYRSYYWYRKEASAGLQYEKLSDGTYAVTGYTGTDSEIIIPSTYDGASVTAIEDSAFLDCTNLTSVTIPDSVTSIGFGAFQGCTNLESVTIGSGVTSIGSYAFYDCTKLTSITIPDSVTSIGDNAFVTCTKLASATFANTATWYVTTNSDYTGGTKLDSSDLAVESTAAGYLRDTYAYQYWYRVDGSVGLTYGELSDGTYAVTGIGDCTDKVIVIPSTYDGKSVTAIAASAFYRNTDITSVEIPDSVTSIGNYAFYYCTNLASVTIGNGVTSIGGSAFRGCSKLTSVVIPDSVTSIGSYAFYNCTNLASVTIGGDVTSIGQYAFTDTAYDNDTNNRTDGVLYLTATDGTTKYLLAADTSLSGAYTVADGTKVIAGYAFQNCANITSITIPDSVTSIGNAAFYSCTGLTSITIPAGVTSIGEDVFYGCTGLTSITVSADNAYYQSIDGNLYSKDGTELIVYAPGKTATSFTIPAGVTSIGNDAFIGCSNLMSVTIPDSVTSIGNYAFYECTNLASITIPNSVTSIGDYAFTFCTNLASVTIGSGVTSIGRSTFYECINLTSITIANSVKSIGEYAFYDCTRLTSITIPDSVTSIGWYAFSYCTNLESATFANTATWYVTDSSDYTGGSSLDASELAVESTAAGYLRDTYAYYYWYKE